MSPVMDDPFEGAKSERDETNKLLLASIAQAGQAGKEAFKTAQAEKDRAHAAALARAQQRAALTGQDLGGADTAATTEAADRFGTYFAGEEAAMHGRLGEIGASGQSYLAKVGQIAPFMQQKAIDQAAERENLYKMEVAANQARIDADKAAEDREHLRQIELLNLRNRFDVQADQRSTAAKAPAAPKISNQALLGEAQRVQTQAVPTQPVDFGPEKQPNETWDQYLARLEGAAQGRRTQDRIVAAPLTDLAFEIGQGIGVDPGQLAELYSPASRAAVQRAQETLTPAAKDQTAKKLSQKYAAKGVNLPTAQSVLGNVDFKEAVNWIMAGADGKSREEVEQIIRANFITRDNRNWTAEYHILLGEYLPLLPTDKELSG